MSITKPPPIDIGSKILKNIEFPKTSEDLINLTLIHQYDYSEWVAWMRLNGSSELDVESGIIIVDSNVALQAAIDGAGVALGSFGRKFHNPILRILLQHFLHRRQAYHYREY